MTKITNLSDYGINETDVLGFVNKNGYTDVDSWLVYKKGDKTYGVRVERDGFIPKYNDFHCLNNIDQTKSPVRISDFGKHIEFFFKNGHWGYVTNVYCGGIYPRTEDVEIGKVSGNLMVVEWGDDCFRYVELTPKGKVKKTFYKLSNEINELSYAFYDYNF